MTPTPPDLKTSKTVVNGNSTTDAFTTRNVSIGTSVPAASDKATSAYPSDVKLGFN